MQPALSDTAMPGLISPRLLTPLTPSEKLLAVVEPAVSVSIGGMVSAVTIGGCAKECWTTLPTKMPPSCQNGLPGPVMTCELLAPPQARPNCPPVTKLFSKSIRETLSVSPAMNATALPLVGQGCVASAL